MNKKTSKKTSKTSSSGGITFFKILFLFAYLIYALWCLGVLFYLRVDSYILRAFLSGGFAVFTIASLLLKPRKIFIPLGLLMMTGVTVFFIMREPVNDRIWTRQSAKLATVKWNQADGRRFTIQDIRDFRYRTRDEFETSYLTKEYSLDDIVSLDFIYVAWSSVKVIGHTMLSFGFKDGTYLVFSPEVRRDIGNADTSPIIPGLFKHFNIAIQVGTERDLIELRTNHRKEDVYLYKTTLSKEQREAIFIDLLMQTNDYAENPRFYNSVTTNCTTELIPSLRKGVDIPVFDYSYFLNGYISEAAFKSGFFVKASETQSFDELKNSSHINPKVIDATPTQLENYSKMIRKTK